MALIDQIASDTATAMKAGQPDRVTVLRSLTSAFGNERISLGHELSEAEQLKVVQRQAKQRNDSIDQYGKAGRDDLVNAEKAELEIIQEYLPQQMSQEELEQLVDAAIAQVGATGVAQMGAVMGAATKAAAGRADGSAVAALVRQRLAG